MPQFCAACGAQMADGSTACPACGKSTASSAGGGAAAAPAATAGGMSIGVVALLCYILWIPCIVFLVIEPYNKDKAVRFHAFQGLFLGLGMFVVNFILSITVIGIILVPFVWLGCIIAAILCILKAFKNEKMVLPLIGPLAEKQANNA